MAQELVRTLHGSASEGQSFFERFEILDATFVVEQVVNEFSNFLFGCGVPGVHALQGVNISIGQGEIVGLIGPNGSGKTTLFNCICGIYKLNNGKILLENKEITNCKPSTVARMGVCRSFQITRSFSSLNLIDNLLIAQKHDQETIFSMLRANSPSLKDKALELLEFVGIAHLKDKFANELSFGQQKLLELARSLMRSPKIVLLDEPTAGVNPSMINKIIERIKEANTRLGKTFLIIEHNMDVIMQLAKRVYVLHQGEVIFHDEPNKIKSDPVVIDAYLGG